MTETAVKDRIFGLDIVRGMAILLILYHHTSYIAVQNTFVMFTGGMGGFTSVEFLFVISGFLIGTTVIKMHNQEKFTSITNIKVFWIRRWFRTLPTYYLILVVFFLLRLYERYKVPFSVWKWLSHLLFLQDAFSEEQNQFVGQAWSLCVQEWFYFLFPLVVYLLQFSVKKKSTALLITILTFISLPLLLRIFSAMYIPDLEFDAGFRKMSFYRLDGVAIGALVAFFKYYYSHLWNKYQLKAFMLGLLIYVFLVLGYYYGFFIKYKAGNDTRETFFYKTIYFTIFSFTMGLLLPAFFAMKVKASNYFMTIITFISAISYSIYLTHGVVIEVVSHFYHLLKSGYVRFAIIWVITFVGSYILYHIFEKKMTELRKNFGPKKYAISAFKEAK